MKTHTATPRNARRTCTIEKKWVWLLFGNELSPRFRLIEPLLIFVNMVAPVLLEVLG